MGDTAKYIRKRRLWLKTRQKNRRRFVNEKIFDSFSFMVAMADFNFICYYYGDISLLCRFHRHFVWVAPSTRDLCSDNVLGSVDYRGHHGGQTTKPLM